MLTQSATLKLVTLTVLALIAFAANSVLSRLALESNAIDAASFSVIRLISGAITLFILLGVLKKNQHKNKSRGSWLAGFLLFLYAVSFSYAYLSLDTGTGALILFGSVQITILLISLYTGTHPHLSEWIGIALAFTGFVYLMLPDVSAPSITGFLLMLLAGIAWGGYTLIGRNSSSPLAETSYNFLRTLPFLLVLFVFSLDKIHFSADGIFLAIASGSIASGIGYSIWYAALTHLSNTQAAVVQLLVPIIAALGGVLFVAEPITLRLTIAGLLVLGGVSVVIFGKSYFHQQRHNQR